MKTRSDDDDGDDPGAGDSDGDVQVAHVSHPILRLEVIHPDGTRTSEHRVFCRYQKRSVATGTCCACAHCDSIASSPPSVNCTITIDPAAAAPDPLGLRTEVGAILEKGTVVLDPSATLKQAVTLLRSENRRSFPVVDVNNSIMGVIHETAFLPKMDRSGQRIGIGAAADRPEDVVARIMSGSLAIHEGVPIRRALELLAAAHLREATVVDDDGVPLGLFRDIDGLRWLFQARIS